MSSSMEELTELKDKLEHARPAPWDALPDIELYMDQVLSYMPRQQLGVRESEQLTSAMVNNYIKHGLLPRAKGKKYNREHLAYLTAICLLKQVLSVSDTDLLLKEELQGHPAEGFYSRYRQLLDTALQRTAGGIDENMGVDALSAEALALAISSFAQKTACERLLDIIRIKQEHKPE